MSESFAGFVVGMTLFGALAMGFYERMCHHKKRAELAEHRLMEMSVERDPHAPRLSLQELNQLKR